jgi:hypothetical protein
MVTCVHGRLPRSSQTFSNLPEEKRQRILRIAIDEFADNDYDSASVSRIVARAGIAKGSFYQCFVDKDDPWGDSRRLASRTTLWSVSGFALSRIAGIWKCLRVDASNAC